MTLSGTVDDAVHILTDTDRGLLCGTPLVAGMNVTRIYGPQPDPGEGCWTCMQKRHEITGEGWAP